MIQSHITVFTVIFSIGNSIPVFNIFNTSSDGTKSKSSPEFLTKSFGVYMEEAYLSTDELIKRHGYSSEVHTVVTNDSYILTIHRIPFEKQTKNMKNGEPYKPVVFLQHGLLASSADWVITGPEKALAYILSEAGYDVWMGNVRGNTYSRKHTCLDPKKDAKRFWDFSWHEIGFYDLPAMIDYVISVTKQEKIFYVGHSQGTTAFYVMTSTRPEYNEKIRAQFSLAPVAYMSHVFSPLIRIFSFVSQPMQWIANFIGLYEFLPSTNFLLNLTQFWCSDDSVSQFLCRNALFAVTGFNRKQLNNTLIPVIFGHTPAGSSTKQFVHFGQLYKSGTFQRFDYGYLGNIKKYGTLSPPTYNLSKTTAPVYLFYGQNDWMNSVRDVLKLEADLGTVKGKFLSPDPYWNHMDHIYGIDAAEFIYHRILNLMKSH